MKEHLKNLDSLRFIAAALVLFGHVGHALIHNHYVANPQVVEQDFLFNLADISVVFFFVLSGFLITYLLLHEKEKGNISVKKFYIKRMLRIWPLYYLVVILSFTVFNNIPFFYWMGFTDNIHTSQHSILSTVLFLLISPNVVLLYSWQIGYAMPTWSIGVEEQFYLIWPWIMRKKQPLIFILAIILIVYLFSNGILSSLLSFFESEHLIRSHSKPETFFVFVSRFFSFWASFRIDAMAIGALGAFAIYNGSNFLSIIYKKSFQIILFSVLALLLFFPKMVNYQFYALIFILVIMNLSKNPSSIFNLEYKPLAYLGKISYGIYMYHCFTVIPAIYLVTKIIGLPLNFYSEILTCIIALACTIFIATLSYEYFEKWFLQLKDKISKPAPKAFVAELPNYAAENLRINS
jgi:peptidoglycan/LPS O-acetylase OafA/YrhL